MKRQLIPWAVALLLLAGTAQAGWWDDVGEAKQVDLQEVIDHPQAWKGKEITFTCVFHRVSTFYNPYYTRFVPSQYLNFSVWPVTKKLWKEEDYLSSHSFLFLEKDHPFYPQMVGLKKFTRLKLTGYVQNTFKNTAWIEVRHVEVLDEAISRDSLAEIIRGDRAAAKLAWQQAVDHYTSAEKGDVSDEVRAGIRKKLAQAFLGMGRTDAARSEVEGALDLSPQDPEAKNLLAKLNAATKIPAPQPAPAVAVPERKKPEPVKVRPVDTKRYGEAPPAMPVPEGTKPEAKTPEPEVEAPPRPAPSEMTPPKDTKTPPVAPTPPKEKPEKKPVKKPAAKPAPAPVKLPVPKHRITPPK